MNHKAHEEETMPRSHALRDERRPGCCCVLGMSVHREPVIKARGAGASPECIPTLSVANEKRKRRERYNMRQGNTV